ncbi:NUDIX domain-containing protein [Thermosulfurimonas sp. F29]|uniref:NUDIX hydrolase n=1 Tax=Thermosulfurimonas sp. F29 TaxID=2867247 RepID=UPI001C831873|nr:NUDIX domain-containing protein [Thermosulfurimonas sp. F29]MBX6424025.1 NUDIX domain-containing protein [Thermosulfurimonas sp. F29]
MAKRGRKRKDSPEGMLLEMLEVVDHQGNTMGLLPRGQIHEQKLFHKAVHVMIFNPKGELYLQKRSRLKDENPGKWDSSASGHVSPGEPYPVAARRELKEELGLLCGLKEIGRLEASPETGYEFVVLFKGTTRKVPRPNPMEIEEGRFVSPEELEHWLTQSPEDFTPTFRLLWDRYRRKLLSR